MRSAQAMRQRSASGAMRSVEAWSVAATPVSASSLASNALCLVMISSSTSPSFA